MMTKLSIIILIGALSGCQVYDCSRYKRIVSDSEKSRFLELWADKNVFSRTFAKNDLGSTLGIVGPGRRQILRSAGVEVPSQIVGSYEVPLSIRIIGTNSAEPHGIFLGNRSFLGILVARKDMHSLLLESKITLDALEITNGRVAVICGRDEL